MESEHKSAVLIVLAILLFLGLGVAWPMAWYYQNVNRSAMENGYEQSTLPGAGGVHWVKKDPQKQGVKP